MPIRPFLNGEKFDPETTRILVELTCVALRVGDCDDHVKQAIANKIIGLAKAGERHPDVLCEQVLADIGTPSLEAARSAEPAAPPSVESIP